MDGVVPGEAAVALHVGHEADFACRACTLHAIPAAGSMQPRTAPTGPVYTCLHKDLGLHCSGGMSGC